MRSGLNAAMAARAAGAAKDPARYSILVLPRRWRLAAIASGSRSMPSTTAPASRNSVAWPPPPSVASTARSLPSAHARTAAASTGTWYGTERASDVAVGTLQNKKTPAKKGRGIHGSTFSERDGTGLTGLEPATSGVTDRHSNQLSYSPQPQAPFGAPEYRPAVGSIQRRPALKRVLH